MKSGRQLPLFSDIVAKFPSTRYQGSKARLADWIWEQTATLVFETCLDAFGGTGAVAYRFKQADKTVTYNDVLRFNMWIGKALIQNSHMLLSDEEIERILSRHEGIEYPRFVQETFEDIYFTPEENAWIDQTITNIRRLEDPHQFALAFFALSQACIVKRPYNLFHRKNLYVRTADVERTFGNKTSWDKPFEVWFREFVQQANNAVFDNGRDNRVINQDVMAIEGDFDLVYIDPPYISSKGVATDYRDFYHFLEGLTVYDEWAGQIDMESKHRRLNRVESEWTDKNRIQEAFDRLFKRFQDSILVVSYRTDGIPPESALVYLMEQYKSKVRVAHYGQYQYTLSTNKRSGEMLIIGE